MHFTLCIEFHVVFYIYSIFYVICLFFFFFSSRRRHTRFDCDWSSDVCSSDLRDLTVTGVQTCALPIRSEEHSFFFQAEDGIRDLTVTGVQTCALPIYEI